MLGALIAVRCMNSDCAYTNITFTHVTVFLECSGGGIRTTRKPDLAQGHVSSSGMALRQQNRSCASGIKIKEQHRQGGIWVGLQG